jgi:tetratricopeptide (TPR) repeat protein
MNGAFKISTIKNEAETYLSQGLYKEALTVYQNFLTKTKELDPSLKKIVDESIDRIRSAAIDHNCEKDVSMSGVVTTVTKSKLKDNTTVNDLLVNAQTFIGAGSYERALDEYRRLLGNNYLTSAVIRGVAQCLVHLVQPKHIVNVVDRLAADFFKHPRNRNAFKRSIFKKISKDQYPNHFSALAHDFNVEKGDSA